MRFTSLDIVTPLFGSPYMLLWGSSSMVFNILFLLRWLLLNYYFWVSAVLLITQGLSALHSLAGILLVLCMTSAWLSYTLFLFLQGYAVLFYLSNTINQLANNTKVMYKFNPRMNHLFQDLASVIMVNPFQFRIFSVWTSVPVKDW